MSDSQRRYDRDETALILRRATEGERRVPHDVESGLTLQEIEAAAREAGIDPAAVRRAAAVTPVEVADLRSRLVGAPAAAEVRARFDGVLPASPRIDFQSAVERALGRRGEVTSDPAGLVWHEDHGLGRTTVRAGQDGGVVVVSAEADRRGHLLALVLSLATVIALALQPVGGFAGLAALGGPLAAVLAPLAALAVATRVAWPRLQRPVARRLEGAVLEVGALVEPGDASGMLPGGRSAP